jgi:hypothetical protein
MINEFVRHLVFQKLQIGKRELSVSLKSPSSDVRTQ